MNPQPSDLESTALPFELYPQVMILPMGEIIIYRFAENDEILRTQFL